MKKTQKYMVILALVLPTVLGACGGSESDSGSAVLKATDLDVSVSCGQWTSSLSGNGESDCTTTVKNNSSASGTIYIIWDWMVGGRRCGSGFSTKADGQPGYLNVTANETGYQTAKLNSLCAPLIGDPVPSNIKVSVIE